MPVPAIRQAQAYTPDGKPIASEGLGAAIQSGQANFDADAPVHVRDRLGRAGTVKGSDVAQLLASGGALETDETLAAEAVKQEARSKREETALRSLNPVQAWIGYNEALLRGATIGLSDLLLTSSLGEDYRKEAATRAANPVTILPEIAGAAGAAIATEAVSGGAATPGLAGTLARGGLLPWRIAGGAARAGETVLGGAANALRAPAWGVRAAEAVGEGVGAGAVYGAGEEVSRASLQNTPLTAEKLIAAAGHGAITGGVSTALLGTVAKVTNAIGRGALAGVSETGDIPGAVRRFADKNAIKALTHGDAKRFMNEAGSEERALRIGQKLLDSGADLTNLKKTAKTLEARVAGAESEMKAVATALDGAGIRPDVRAMAATLREQIDALKAVPLGDYRALAGKVERQVKPLLKAIDKGQEYRFGEMLDLRTKLAAATENALQRNNPAAVEARKTLAVFDDALGKTVASTSDDNLAANWQRMASDRADFGLALSAARDGLERDAKPGFKPSDLLAGGAAFLNAITTGGASLVGLAEGAITAKAMQLLREKSPGTVARIADRIAKLDRRSEAVVHALIEGNPKLLPKSAHTKALGESVKETHRVATGIEGAHADAPTPRPARAAVGIAAEGKAPELKRADLTKDYQSAVSEVLEATSGPMAVETIKRIGTATAPIANDFPELATAIAQRIQQNNIFLRSKVPAVIGSDLSLTPGADPKYVPPGEAERFLRYRDGAESFEGTIRDVASGDLPIEKLEAMRANFPEEYRLIQARIATAAADRGKPLPFKQRLLLSVAFDLPTDPTLTPDGIAGIQGLFAQSAQGAPQGMPPAQPVNPKVAQSHDLSNQRSLRSP
jgi:hypothetical protein